MDYLVYALFALIPLAVLLLIITAIIRVLMHKTTGHINYGKYALNILENNTTTDTKENTETDEEVNG